MTQHTHGLDPNALEAAESAYAAATMDLPHHDCEDCGGSGVVTTGRGEMAGGDSCSTCGGGGVVVDFPDGWNPMASAIAAYLAALSQNPGTSNTSGGAVAISVKTMKLSDGREDHYVSIRVGDREITPHKYSIKGRAEFDVAEWNWLLNGAEKPDVVDWLDRTRPLAALEPRASDREAVAHGLQLAAKWHDQRAHDTPDAFEAEFHQVSAAAIRKLSDVSKATAATHRHVKRGIEYALIGYGKMQTQEWYEDDRDVDYRPVANTVDMREVAIYRSVDDGSLWVRPREEFEDGRFIKLSEVSHEH